MCNLDNHNSGKHPESAAACLYPALVPTTKSRHLPGNAFKRNRASLATEVSVPKMPERKRFCCFRHGGWFVWVLVVFFFFFKKSISQSVKFDKVQKISDPVPGKPGPEELLYYCGIELHCQFV